MLPLSVWQMLVGRPTPRISLPGLARPGLANCTRCGVALFNPGSTRGTIAQNTKESHSCSYSYSALRYSYSRLNSHDRVRVRVGVPGYALSTSRSRVTMLTCGTATLPLPPSIVLVLSTAVLVLVVSVLNTISAHSYGVALFSASGTSSAIQ